MTARQELLEICFAARKGEWSYDSDPPDVYGTRTAVMGALGGAGAGGLTGAIIRDAMDEAKNIEYKKRTLGRLGIPALIGASIGAAGLGALGYYSGRNRDRALRDYRRELMDDKLEYQRQALRSVIAAKGAMKPWGKQYG